MTATLEGLRRPESTRPQALRRCVVNLIDNALKFAPGTAELVVERAAAAVTIAVLDRGPGMDPGRVAEALKPFRRLEPSRSGDSGGTGLGLAIAQRLSHALGAPLQLLMRSGGGQRARLPLPVDVGALLPGRAN